MKERFNWLSRLLPSPQEHMESGAGPGNSYSLFTRSLFVILSVSVLVPSTIISVLSHYQYQQLLKGEELVRLSQDLSQAQATVDRFLSEIQLVIGVVVGDYRYQELLDLQELESIFVRLTNEYSEIVDIEVVDSRETRSAYFGPYQAGKTSYVDRRWYKDVLRRGWAIANLSSRSGEVDRLAVAVSRKHAAEQGAWVLRVTFQGKLLQDYIDRINTSGFSDLFLIDSKDRVQTKPRNYGTMGEIYRRPKIGYTGNSDLSNMLSGGDVLSKKGMDIIVEETADGKQVLHAIVELQHYPWRLVIVEELFLLDDERIFIRLRLIAIFVLCTIIAVFVILGLCRTITDHIRRSDKKRQQFLAEVEHSNKLASIGRLAAGVAHEINNPLSIINQKAGLVQDFIEMSEGFGHKESMLETLEGIQKSVLRCKAITHRLLGFARQTDVQTEELDINVILREVVDFLAKEAMYNQIRIDFDLDRHVSKLFSDRNQLQQIFLNITSNAIDAIGRDGQITFSSKQLDRDTIQIAITDNGPGMASDVRKHIFDPFFTTKKTGEGTGLGLSISYGLVQKLGGSIKVISELGVGTSFEITLPVDQSLHKGS